jgi:monofunctional biosynthetic peptidoglycan transglycosylase
MPLHSQIRKLSIKFIKYGTITITALALLLSGLYWYLPDPAKLKFENPKTTSFIDLKCSAECPLQWTPLSEISFFVKRAVVQAEDSTFYSHSGISLSSLEQALRINLSEGRFVWGGSTITMQLARNLYLQPDKTIIRKLQEILLALKIERALSKDRILEIYLNVAEWRPDIFGITTASKHIFKKKPRELGPLEAAFLASILPSPRLASDPEVRKRFRQKGALIFDRLFQEQLPRGVHGDNKTSCTEQLHPREISTVDDILTVIFAQKGINIITGDGALLSFDQVSALLDERQNAFIQRLKSKMSSGEPALDCQLSKTTDKELLMPLDQNEDSYHIWVPSAVYLNLKDLIESAAKDGFILHIESGYRGAGYQTYLILKELRARNYCLSEVKTLVEAPGYSEHGCLDNIAFDFSSPEGGGKPFVETNAFKWLLQHGQKFGFSMSYPEEATGKIRYEPWHWRFMGTEEFNRMTLE